ncbi:Uncharacterised protein [Amycolatopsis camponoti]|uniref:Uncharacterized protein n=1 Tax=Amycolatopsis camponoti TaxID=2606593 RepID=A0A6I8LLZ5_9PSEU|nr:Uncharacterised protein [Amycolatopsis camponoti]
MSLPQQQSPQLRNPLTPEPMRNPSQAQSPPRRTTRIENGSSQPPATLDDKPRIHRIPPNPSSRNVPPNLTDVVLRPVSSKIHPPQVVVNLPIRKMSQNHHPRRNHPQRKPSSLEQNMTPNGKRPILPDQADRLLPPPRGKERTLPRSKGKPPDNRQSGLGDVITPSSSHSEEVKLRPQHPPVTIPLHHPDTLQRHQQPMHGRPGQPRLPGQSRRRGTPGLMNRDSPQSPMGPADEISRSVHSVNTTPPESTTRRTTRR